MEKDSLQSTQALTREVKLLRNRVEAYEKRMAELEDQAEALKYSDLIIQNSPVVLFRRLAAEELKDRRMVYVSPNISRFGYSAEDFLTNRIMFRDIVYHRDTERTKKEILEYVSKGMDSYTQAYRILTRDGKVRWVEDRTSVVVDPGTGIRYHQGIVIDIHERKTAEEKLLRSEEKHRRIVENAGEGFLFMDHGFTIVDLNTALCRMVEGTPESLIGMRLPELLTDKYRHIVSANLEEELGGKNYRYEAELASATGAAVPVLIHGSALHGAGGVIGNTAFVTDMTQQKKALQLAAEVQKSLLPAGAPKVRGIDMAGKNIPCDEVGGDYYDFLPGTQSPDRVVSVVVGDISGHGVDSALLMTTARAFLRMRASRPGTPAEVVTAMNRHLSADVSDSGKFMTLFYLTVNREAESVEWVRAGHEPAWLFDPGENTFEELKGPGTALGVDEDHVYRGNLRRGLKPGQIVVVGTDGIWEGRNKAGEMFGKHRFQEVVRANASASAREILGAVFREQGRFTLGMQPEDDLTLVVVKITE